MNSSVAAVTGYRGGIHIVWDVRSLPSAALPQTSIIDLVVQQAQTTDDIRSIHAVTGTTSAPLLVALRGAGVPLEHANGSVPVCVVTQLLRLSLALQSTSNSNTGTSLLMVSDDGELAPALASLRQSGLFHRTVLLTNNQSGELNSIANTTIQWQQLVQSFAAHSIAKGHPPSPLTLPAPLVDSQNSRNRRAPRGQRHMPPPTQLPQQPVSAVAPQQLLPARSPSPVPPSQPHSQPSHNICTNSVRRLFAPTPAPVAPAQTELLLSLFRSTISYCEKELIIPRESVVKKRFDDSVRNLVSFEHFLSLLLTTNSAMVEGDAPQRIIWPIIDSQIHRFPCADFFQPSLRLTADQNNELLTFLSVQQPDIEHGRFGFAQHLCYHGPVFLLRQPLGVLLELVQWLLNQKQLVFRKGRVRVSSSLARKCGNKHPQPESLSQSCPTTPVAGSKILGGKGRSRLPSAQVPLPLPSLRINLPHAPAQSDRSFIPATVLPLTAEFDAIGLLQSLTVRSRLSSESEGDSSYSSYPRHLPVYHFEHSVNTSTGSNTDAEAQWVAVCTVNLRNPALSMSIPVRRYKSTQHRSTLTAKQESATRALQELLWILVFNCCLVELRQKYSTVSVGDSSSAGGDSVDELDRLLAHCQQSPVIYELDNVRPSAQHYRHQHHQRSSSVRSMWQCHATVHLRAGSQSQLSSHAAGGNCLELITRNGRTLSVPSFPLHCSSEQSKKPDAKNEVATQLLHRINVRARNGHGPAAVPALPTLPAPALSAAAPSFVPTATWTIPRLAIPSSVQKVSGRVRAEGEAEDSMELDGFHSQAEDETEETDDGMAEGTPRTHHSSYDSVPSALDVARVFGFAESHDDCPFAMNLRSLRISDAADGELDESEFMLPHALFSPS